ncbi:PREDICTED: myoneurin-like isoform X2 [Papilio polytes]|uniref:myoneurin-like isoform X2 n=1 Tax=Papilio polytes TaxID=76194 RepID=UPI000675FAE9|nr:PREDICTED: myoneurin-like isoform X2 [Papilio polytes]
MSSDRHCCVPGCKERGEPLRLQKSSNRKPMQEISDENKPLTSFDPVASNLAEALPLNTSHTKTQQNLVMAGHNACGGDRFPESPRRPGVLLSSDDFDEIVQYKGSSRWYTRAGHFYVASRSRGASTTMRCSTDRCPAHWILRDGKAGPTKGLHNHPPTPWVLNRNIMFQALKRRASEEDIPLSTIYEEEAARYPDAASHLLYQCVLPSMRKWRRNSQLGVFPPLENSVVTQQNTEMGASRHIFLDDDIIPDVHKLCRLCLCQTEDCLPIYRDSKHESYPDIALRIAMCVGIEVSKDDCLPKKLCRQCYRDIERCYIFREKCEVSNKKLKLHAAAVRENKKLMENQRGVKRNFKEGNDLLTFSNERTYGKTYSNRLSNKKNNVNLHSNTQKEIQETPSKVEPENVEPSFEAFLTTVLLQLGVVERKDEKMILQNPNVKTLELETQNGKVLVELTEEEPDDEFQDNLSEETISVSNSVNSMPSSEESVPIKLEQNAKGKKAGAGGGAGAEACGQWARCAACGKGFLSRSALRRHERVHSGERPHACRVCRRTFAQRAVMLRHELVHREQRPYQCGTCPKSFTQRSSLEAHAHAHAEPRQRALSLRPCPNCDKVFLYASGLSRHMRVHSGRVYECSECARPFCDKSSLRRHLRSVPHPPPLASPSPAVSPPASSSPPPPPLPSLPALDTSPDIVLQSDSLMS